MIAAAQFGALAIEHTLAVGLEPGFVETARNGVDLDAERRHRKRMDHVGPGDLNAHGLVHRHHHVIVDREQPWTLTYRPSLVTGQQ